MTHGSLFSGIGGFDLAAQWMGWTNVFHCEWNEFNQKVLHHYWPNAEQFTDITKSDFTKYENAIDIISGGFPCQPYSVAGKRKGKEDERHLWPEMLRTIREVRPRWVVGENVFGLVNWSGGLVFHEVQADLEAEGYEVFPYVLPAVSVNAPHKRDRVWFVAYAGREFGAQSFQPGNNGIKVQRQRTEEKRSENRELLKVAPGCSSIFEGWMDLSKYAFDNDGIPAGLANYSLSEQDWQASCLRSAGNAIVPQVALQIFKAIEQYEMLISEQEQERSVANTLNQGTES